MAAWGYEFYLRVLKVSLKTKTKQKLFKNLLKKHTSSLNRFPDNLVR